MLRDELTVLAAFTVVADERSSRARRAASPRRTRESACWQLHPALHDIQAALTEVGRLREKPAGVVRLIASPMAVAMIVNPKLPRFARDYPDVTLDITTEGDSRPDLVAGRFDAGIHLGEFVQRDMVAVKVSRQQAHITLSSIPPALLDRRP